MRSIAACFQGGNGGSNSIFALSDSVEVVVLGDCSALQLQLVQSLLQLQLLLLSEVTVEEDVEPALDLLPSQQQQLFAQFRQQLLLLDGAVGKELCSIVGGTVSTTTLAVRVTSSAVKLFLTRETKVLLAKCYGR